MTEQIIEVENTAGELEEFVIITNPDGSKTGIKKILWDAQQASKKNDTLS